MILLLTLPDLISRYPFPCPLCSRSPCCSGNRPDMPLPREFAIPSTSNPLPSEIFMTPLLLPSNLCLNAFLVRLSLTVTFKTYLYPPTHTLLSFLLLPCFNFLHSSYLLPEHYIHIYFVLLFTYTLK